jgi:hypothetical protein
MSLSASLVLPRLVSSTDRRGLSARICSFTERGKNGGLTGIRTQTELLKREPCNRNTSGPLKILVDRPGLEPRPQRLKDASSAARYRSRLLKPSILLREVVAQRLRQLLVALPAQQLTLQNFIPKLLIGERGAIR